jgi:hypothetical protein
MPPQQAQHLLDFGDGFLGFGTHGKFRKIHVPPM